MAETKNPGNIQIGQRIKQARKLAGFKSAAQLLEQITAHGTSWGKSRLGNYEAGISQPSPDDISIIAKITQTSPCWLMFGDDSMHAIQLNQQAIRHKNLQTLIDDCLLKPAQYQRLLQSTGLTPQRLEEHLLYPYLTISDQLARCCEKYANLANHWMDKQHFEDDAAYLELPDKMRRLMEIYANLDHAGQTRLLEIAEIIDGATTNDCHSEMT